MKKSYNNFFALSVGSSSILMGVNTLGGPLGVLAGLAATTGIILVDKHLFNNKLSETTIKNIKDVFTKKPKI